MHYDDSKVRHTGFNEIGQKKKKKKLYLPSKIGKRRDRSDLVETFKILNGNYTVDKD